MLQITDPSWFYSSLSQAAAAIVGLVGAVLGSRIVDHIAQMRGERLSLDESVTTVYGSLTPRLDHFVALRSFFTKEIHQDTVAIGRGEKTRPFTDEIGWTFTSGTKLEQVEVENHRQVLEDQLHLLDSILHVFPTFSGEIQEMSANLSELKRIIHSLPQEHTAKTSLQNYWETLEGLNKAISRFRSKLLPRSFVIVLFLLGWLVVVGILWPLSALPGLPELFESKTLMLTALGMGLLGLIFYFGYQLFEAWHLGRFYWEK
jgi:hypothetical protein